MLIHFNLGFYKYSNVLKFCTLTSLHNTFKSNSAFMHKLNRIYYRKRQSTYNVYFPLSINDLSFDIELSLHVNTETFKHNYNLLKLTREHKMWTTPHVVPTVSFFSYFCYFLLCFLCSDISLFVRY